MNRVAPQMRNVSHNGWQYSHNDPWQELSTTSSGGLEIQTRTAMTWVGNTDMSTELMALRMLAVCAEENDIALLREGVALASLPLELVEADSAPKACALLSAQEIDLVLIDGALAASDRVRIAKAARDADKPAFVVLLSEDQNASAACADAMTAKPRDTKTAMATVDGCVQSRLPRRVLVVDDSATMRSIVRKILAASNFPLQLADVSEGQAALDMLGKDEADIVFLDYNMPGLNGVDTLKALKSANRDIRVVIMTSATDESVASLARAAGADAFLRKPFYPADVDAVIYGLFGLTQLAPAKS